jgi:ubiquinone/menaquinone biosynthesis C-methylase UbiE
MGFMAGRHRIDQVTFERKPNCISMHDKRFKPSESHRLEDPERLTWLPPAEVLAYLDLEPGMNVADIGTGTGYFAIPMAKAIAPSGRVFAVDVEPEMLEKLRQKLTEPDAPKNIDLFEGEASITPLPSMSASRVLIANVWHELDDHATTLKEIRRILREEGKLAILDWRSDVDPPPGPPLEHRISSEQVVSFLVAQGCKVHDAVHSGMYSYLVIASMHP